jgi:hypothetical protein
LFQNPHHAHHVDSDAKGTRRGKFSISFLDIPLLTSFSLVDFLSHGNTQIRQVAAEHLVGYSTTHTSIFKTNQLQPVKDLKLLVKDYPQIAKNALTILINISHDVEVLRDLANDDEFLGQLLSRITVCQFPKSGNHIA